MSTFTLHRKHTMARCELVARVEKLADTIVSRYGGDYQWQGDVLCYEYGGGVSAKINCAPEDITVEVTLGMLMGMLKGPMSREIENYLDREIS